jgi:LPXTG-motif cell wall-anchored protein
MIRMPHLTWRQRLALTAAALVFAVVGGIDLAGAPAASATNAATAVTSTCENGRWTVAMSVTSQFDGTIHVQLSDPHGPIPLFELAPHATKTITEHPDAGSNSWSWVWTSPDGHLLGDAVSGKVTRPDGCGTPTTTTAAPPTTTCAAAIPPRDDCGDTPPATVATTIPATVDATTTVPAAATSTEPTNPPSSDSATTARRAPASPAGPSTSIPITLPTTGSTPTGPVVAGAAALLLGGLLLLVRRRTA